MESNAQPFEMSAYHGGFNRGLAPPAGLGQMSIEGDVRRDVALAQIMHEAFDIESLIGTHGDPPPSGAIDGRTLRHAGYDISQRFPKRIKEVFGWLKTTGGIAEVKVRGPVKVQAVFTFAILAYNLVRIPKLPGAT
jgi:hypothetical protein